MFEIELFICIKMELALNNLQRLICHKTQTKNRIRFIILNFLSECFNIVYYQKYSKGKEAKKKGKKVNLSPKVK